MPANDNDPREDMHRPRLFWQLYPATLLIALAGAGGGGDGRLALAPPLLPRPHGRGPRIQGPPGRGPDRSAPGGQEICRDRRPLQGSRQTQFHAADGHPAGRQGRGRLGAIAAGNGQPRQAARGQGDPGRGQGRGRLPALQPDDATSRLRYVAVPRPRPGSNAGRGADVPFRCCRSTVRCGRFSATSSRPVC